MTKSVQFKVGMTCGGCSSAVTKILMKIEGVQEVDCNVETKDVKVFCEDSVEDTRLLEALYKWGSASNKSVELVSS